MVRLNWKPVDFFTVENGEPVHYIRRGECNQCGACCCTHTITYRMETRLSGWWNDEDWTAADWADWEGWTIFWAQGIWWAFLVTKVEPKDMPCEGFEPDTRLCTAWNNLEDWKPICRYWPFCAADLEVFPACGYWFEEAPEGDKDLQEKNESTP